jgi:LysM repeat protein
MRSRLILGAVVLALMMALGMGGVMTAQAEEADAAPAASWTWVYHKVKYGETLSGVALHYGVSWHTIANANGLGYPYTIYAGKVLKIPYYGAAPHKPVYHKGNHLVKKGETVYSIAKLHGVSAHSIIAANNLHYPYTIYAGSYIWVGSKSHPAPGKYHVVKAGDTLIRIGQYYGVPWGDIAHANGLSYPFNIRIGQKLHIPTRYAWAY